MRITAHLGVLDEVELIASAIDHLYKIGVDHVIVFDMGSKDGTLEIAEGYQGPDFELVRLCNDTSWDELRKKTVESVRRATADWVLFLDADEFWLPATGSIRDCIALVEHDIVTVDRFNVVLTDSGLAMPRELGPEAYPRTFLYTRLIDNFRKYLAANPDTPWISGVPVSKVIGRTGFLESITMGRHDIVTADGRPVRRTTATDVVIAHVPFSSFSRFERRVANIADFFELNGDYLQGAQGWHWRRLYELSQQGRIAEEYLRQVISQPRLDELIASGSVHTAAQLLGSGQET